jgi:hypothetical protein
MAVATLQWSPHAGAPGDGSASNAGPALLNLAGTEANPKKPLLIASFDAATQEHLWFQGRMPDDFKEIPIVKLLWMALSKEAQKVVWGARLGAITPTDADTPVEHAEAEAVTATVEVNTAEARRLITTTIEPKLDSIAAGDFFELLVFREAASGSDTLAVDAELLSVALTYTTT